MLSDGIELSPALVQGDAARRARRPAVGNVLIFLNVGAPR